MANPRRAFAPQIELPSHELTRLIQRIETDYNGALADHEARMRRFVRYYSRWRDLDDPRSIEDSKRSKYRVPLMQWQVYAKWAKEVDSLFGEDAEIIAEAVGPSDFRTTHKVAKFMNWRCFNSMKLVRKAALFSFRKILFGRSHAYAPWETRTFQVPMDDGSMQEMVDYDGPGFDPRWPDDLMVPAEDAASIQEFSFVLDKARFTPDQLLRGQDAGRFQKIDELMDLIVGYAENNRARDDESEPLRMVSDEAEGVTRDSALSSAGALRCWSWYGRWRRLKTGRSTRVDNLKGRDKYESDVLVKYLPDLHQIVGVQDLSEMYPTTPRRRPFVEAALTQDGSYWGPSFGEMLEKIEVEMSRAHQQGADAGAFTVGPLIFYRPDSGFDPDTFEYEPHACVAVDNPQGIQVVQLKADLTYPITAQQGLGADAERVTGQNDETLGRQSDRPNAPRTARQFVGLIEQGNVRASIDVKMFREDWREALDHFWGLETMYGNPNQFFRVTEQDARGLFEVSQGGAKLTHQERQGKYDFSLKLATSAQSREADKERKIALYQVDIANPLVVNNQRALWKVTNSVHEAMGDPNFKELVPEPPDPGQARKPSDEWTLMLQGEDVLPHPDDNDDDHLTQHLKQLHDHKTGPGEVDQDAVDRLVVHIGATHSQKQQKLLMRSLIDELTTQLAKNQGTGTGLQVGGMPASLADVGQTLNDLQNPGAAQPQQPPRAA
ncbi:MAG: hypothetical protein IT163_09815 [Bryobacterales bacterium]|nr:hypothetical protein [Bryobacterales bacterium]